MCCEYMRPKQGSGARVVPLASLAYRDTATFAWFAPADLAAIPLSTTARKALKLAGIE